MGEIRFELGRLELGRLTAVIFLDVISDSFEENRCISSLKQIGGSSSVLLLLYSEVSGSRDSVTWPFLCVVDGAL